MFLKHQSYKRGPIALPKRELPEITMWNGIPQIPQGDSIPAGRGSSVAGWQLESKFGKTAFDH